MADEPQETPQEPTSAVEPPAMASPSPQTLRLGDDTPSPASVPGKPLETGGKGKALVRTRFPHDSFDHGLSGVKPITAHGIEVDRGKVQGLIEAAKAAGVELEEIEDA